MRIIVLDTIQERHPHISKKDVISAFHSVYITVQREDTNGSETPWIAIGLDARGRDMEICYVQKNSTIIIYHALTPVTKKMLNEINHLKQKGHYYERPRNTT